MPKRLTQNQVKEELKALGYDLIGLYKGASNYIEVKCQNNHITQRKLGDIRNGFNCFNCRYPVNVADFVKSVNFVLLSKPSKKTITVKCQNNHVSSVSWSNFYNGSIRCKECYTEQQRKIKNPTTYIESFGYQLKTKYEQRHKKLDLICPKGHHWSVTYANFLCGRRCGECYNLTLWSQIANESISYRVITKRLSQTRSTLKTEQIRELSKLCLTVYQNCPQGETVDHIVPFSWFDSGDFDSMAWCWCSGNLRYLPHSANVAKGNKLDYLTLWQYIDQRPGFWQIVLAAKYTPEHIRKETLDYLGFY